MLRAVTEKDYLDWWRIYMDDSVNPFLYFDQMDEKKFKPIFDDFCKKGKMFVFEKNHETVGICQLILLPKPYQDTLIIGSIAIDPNHQRKGYATGLFKDIFKWIKETHPEIARVELYAETDNPNARKLYEKIGFKTEVVLSDWFKRHNGSHQHKWYMSEHIMTLMLKEIPNHVATKTQKLSKNNAKSIFREANSNDEAAVLNLIKKQNDFLEIDFQRNLKRGDVYVLAQDKTIIAYAYIKQGSGRLGHNAFFETCIVDSECNDNMVHDFLKQIIQSQLQKKMKRLEINLLETESTLIKNFLAVGFEYKGKLKARFKHPTTQEYFDQEVLEYSLFNLDDAIKCVEASESKTIDKNALIHYLKKIKSMKLNPEAEHLIYKFVREMFKDN